MRLRVLAEDRTSLVSPLSALIELGGRAFLQVPVAVLSLGGCVQTNLQRAQLFKDRLYVFLLRELCEPGFQRAHLIREPLYLGRCRYAQHPPQPSQDSPTDGIADTLPAQRFGEGAACRLAEERTAVESVDSRGGQPHAGIVGFPGCFGRFLFSTTSHSPLCSGKRKVEEESLIDRREIFRGLCHLFFCHWHRPFRLHCERRS